MNSKGTVDDMWEERGYDKKQPDEIHDRLGYRLDGEEATGYVVTSACNLPKPPAAGRSGGAKHRQAHHFFRHPVRYHRQEAEGAEEARHECGGVPAGTLRG